MRSSSYLAAQNLLFCKGQEYLETLLPALTLQLKKHGYCVVQMWDLTEVPLIALRNRLGRGQLHIRAAQNGVVTISPNASSSQILDESHYYGASARKHSPHTDGAYLSGFLQQGKAFKRVGPPAIVLLQCVRSAYNGGTSIVIDAQRILRDLLIHTPEVAKVLLSPGCISFCRDDHMVLDVPVYERLTANRWRVRFRCDEMLYPSDWANEAIQHLHTHYLSNESYQKRIDLQEGQILLLDNFRVLHGREAFSVAGEQDRFLRRTWVHDDSSSQRAINFCNSYPSCRAFERYAVYRAMAHSNATTPHILDLGIRLPQHLQAIVNEQDFQSVPNVA